MTFTAWCLIFLSAWNFVLSVAIIALYNELQK